MRRQEGEHDAWRGRLTPPRTESSPTTGAAESKGPGPWVFLAFAGLGIAMGAATLEAYLSRAPVGTVEVVEASSPRSGASSVDASVIDAASMEEWIVRLAAPELEGRDSPSPGLAKAQAIVAAEMEAIGLEPAGDRVPRAVPPDRAIDPSLAPWLQSFRAATADLGHTRYRTPDADRCSLGMGSTTFELWRDFVPLVGARGRAKPFDGEARATAVFAGYAIDRPEEDYDDFAKVDVRDRIAVFLAGEPDGAAFEGRFEDADVSAEACLWNKLDALWRQGAAGALVVVDSDPPVFRRTYARWNPPSLDRVRKGVPTLLVSERVASVILGRDVAALRGEIEASGAAIESAPTGAEVALVAATSEGPATLLNVVGRLPASTRTAEPALVVGAHLDHVGVGPRGRIAYGADDNASGVAALLGIARVLAALPDRSRDVLFVAFSGEEDGLLGAQASAESLDGHVEAMLNLDMIGHGPADEVALFGADTSPSWRARLDAALAAGGHGVARLRLVEEPQFFQRSDHYAFHRRGVPVLFFFEDWPHRSRVYHTWKDTPETVDAEKVARTARLAAQVAAGFLTES